MMKLAFRSLLSSMLLVAAAVADEEDSDMPTNTTAPVCGDDEELFQLQINTDEVFGFGRNRASYRVVTESTNEIHDECKDCDFLRSPIDSKLCLPRNGCHTALLGKSHRHVSCRDAGVPLLDRRGGIDLLVTWGDTTLRRSNGWLFDRINFGDGCPAEPVCDKDNEIFFEFFTERDNFNMDEDDPPDAFSWALVEMENGTPNEVVLLEGQAKNQESHPFIYETACVPRRNSCLEFHMWNPNPPDGSSISVRLDGVIYSEGQIKSGGDNNDPPQTVKLSKNCPAEIACDATSEDLFALEYEVTRAPEDVCSDNDLYEFSSAVKGLDAPNFFLYYDGTIDNYVWSSHHENGFEVNQTYAFLKCIPNDECATFYMESNYTGEFWYKLFQNGAELTDRNVRGKHNIETMAGACAFGAETVSSGAGTLFSVPGGVALSSTLAVFALLV